MNKKVVLVLALALVAFGAFLLFFGDKEEEIEDKKKKNWVKKVQNVKIDLKLYRDGIPFQKIRIKPIDSLKLRKRIQYDYHWYVNGEEQTEESNIFDITKLSKGAEVHCIVYPTLMDVELKALRTEKILIPNSPPIIKANPIEKFSIPGKFNYQINAEDPDGDDLTYSLVSPLDKGIYIDANTGNLVWDLNEENLRIHKAYKGQKPPSGEETGPIADPELINFIKIRYKVEDVDGAISIGEINLDLARGTEVQS